MKSIAFRIVVLLLVNLTIICQAETTTKPTTTAKNQTLSRCQKPNDGQHICFCGKNRVAFDRLKGEKCVKGIVRINYQRKYVYSKSD